MATLLRPDTVTVERRVHSGAVSPTGEPLETVTTIHTGLPVGINQVPVVSAQGGNFETRIAQVLYLQTHLGFVDGLAPARIKGAASGTVIVVNGINYIVNGNGTAAFPDIQSNDRWTDQEGNRLLVLAVAHYVTVIPTLQVRLSLGSGWNEA